ncbi:hypothetical protein HPCPY1962_1426 [Helicobacter pylori CPY1962]|nr:hypothetical protein HPCPY1962_1426 [Helicobacter pylori CPY1962]
MITKDSRRFFDAVSYDGISVFFNAVSLISIYNFFSNQSPFLNHTH